MIKEYENNYAKYFEDQMTKFESFEGDLYYQQIADTIKHVFGREIGGKQVLDFCCGDGTSTSLIGGMGFNVVGVDGNSNKIQRAITKCDSAFMILDAENESAFYGTWRFDVIYASHCFEHFLNPIKVLMNISTILKEDGKIILILPYPNEENEGHPGSGELKLDKDISEIRSLFEENGFVVSKIEKMNIREPELLIELKRKHEIA